MLKPILTALLLTSGAVPALAQRLEAEAECSATDTPLEYECAIRLTTDGAPVDEAEFEVKADMPDMPMAHNLPPVPAEPGDVPGSYRVLLPLEMHGRWTLRLEISAPRRDLVIVDHEFLPDDQPATSAGHGHGN